jgi:hypothetical protein
MGMKAMDLLDAGGMFVEFFAMDFDEDFMLVGHAGPSNITMASGRPRLKHLDVQHGKSGHGLGIDSDIRPGPVTLINLTQNDPGETFKLIYTVGEVVPGPTLAIGNPNCRVRLQKPLHEFMDAWCLPSRPTGILRTRASSTPVPRDARRTESCPGPLPLQSDIGCRHGTLDVARVVGGRDEERFVGGRGEVDPPLEHPAEVSLERLRIAARR